jgi:hypothetical protein
MEVIMQGDEALRRIRSWLQVYKVKFVDTDANGNLVLTTAKGDRLVLSQHDQSAEWLIVEPVFLEDL